MGRAFAREKGLEKFETEFAKGAQAAQDPTVYDLPLLSDEDKEILRREVTHKWDQPKTLWFLVICCSAAAAVQGMVRSILLTCADALNTRRFGRETSPKCTFVSKAS